MAVLWRRLSSTRELTRIADANVSLLGVAIVDAVLDYVVGRCLIVAVMYMGRNKYSLLMRRFLLVMTLQSGCYKSILVSKFRLLQVVEVVIHAC